MPRDKRGVVTVTGRARRTALHAPGAALTALVFTAAVHASLRGYDPFRSVALTVVLLGLPLLVGVAFLSRASRSHPVTASAAGGVTLYCFVVAASIANERFGLVVPRIENLALDVALAAGAVAVFFLLRRLFATVREMLPAGSRRLGARLAALGAFLLLAAGLAPWPVSHPSPAATGNEPNVLLVTIDALRPDHLSAYGYPVHETPSLDRVGREGARYEEAYATAPWTLPSVASMMTGYDPSVLGVRRQHDALPEGLPTLAELLAYAGYETHAIVTNVFLERPYGLHHGFRTYHHLRDLGLYDDLHRHPIYQLAQRAKGKFLRADADRLTDQAIRWLGSERDRPFFLWLHYLDPHVPYGGAHVADDLPCGSREAQEIGARFDEHRAVRRGERRLSAAEREHLVHLYDAEIRYFDHHFGRLLDHLDRTGLADETLLVVTSEHGEEFWDQGGFEHGHSVHRVVTRVPLLVRWPGRVREGTVVRTPVSLLGLTPTVLRATGVPGPDTQGRPLPFDEGEPSPEPVFSENTLYGPEQKAIRTERFTVIFRPEDGTFVVYDRATDPEEIRPLRGPVDPELRALVAERIESNAALASKIAAERRDPARLTESQREQLRSLGYLE